MKRFEWMNYVILSLNLKGGMEKSSLLIFFTSFNQHLQGSKEYGSFRYVVVNIFLTCVNMLFFQFMSMLICVSIFSFIDNFSCQWPPLFGKIRVTENPYSSTFYTVKFYSKKSIFQLETINSANDDSKNFFNKHSRFNACRQKYKVGEKIKFMQVLVGVIRNLFQVIIKVVSDIVFESARIPKDTYTSYKNLPFLYKKRSEHTTSDMTISELRESKSVKKWKIRQTFNFGRFK